MKIPDVSESVCFRIGFSFFFFQCNYRGKQKIRVKII